MIQKLDFHLGLTEITSQADVDRGLSRLLCGAGTRDEPPRTSAWEAIFGFACIALRDGPLEKLWGEWGIFEPQEFFFVIKFLVLIFF